MLHPHGAFPSGEYAVPEMDYAIDSIAGPQEFYQNHKGQGSLGNTQDPNNFEDHAERY